MTTMFAFPYYGLKSSGFVSGSKYKYYYLWFYLLTILWGSMQEIDVVIDLTNGVFAMMSIPTILSTIWLSPKVIAASKVYFKKLK